MKRSERIQTIVELKALQEQKSLEVLAKCQQKHQDALQQLEHLQSYRREYMEKFQSNSSGGMGVKVLLDFRLFIDKLDQAIAGQIKLLQETEQDVMQQRKVWEGMHQHTKSLQKVCDGIVAEENQMQHKREQAESDR